MTEQQPRRRGRVVLLLVLALVLAVADQVTKYLAEERLTQGVLVPLIGDVIGLQLIYNPGAAFSLATGMTWVFTVITLLVVVFIVRVSRRLRSTVWAVTLGLLLGGALGNLYDRLFREPGFGRGHVVDFINYNGWFVGNIADIAIVVAAVLIAVLALLGIEVDGTRVQKQRDEEPDEVAGTPEDDASLEDEQPLADDEDFTPEVPRPTDEGVDVATWVNGAPSASEVGRTQGLPPVAVPGEQPSAATDHGPEPSGAVAPGAEPADASAHAGGPAGADADARTDAPAGAADDVTAAEDVPGSTADDLTAAGDAPVRADEAAPAGLASASTAGDVAAGGTEARADAAGESSGGGTRRRPRSRREARLTTQDDG